MYKEDDATREKLDKILEISPAHKGALLYMNKLTLHQLRTPADKDAINKFFVLITAKKKSWVVKGEWWVIQPAFAVIRNNKVFDADFANS